MKKYLSIFLVSIILLNFVSANINERELKQNIKETFIEKLMKDIGITSKVSQEINESNPEAMKNLQNTCQKTEGARVLIAILTIGSIIGLFTLTPVGIVGLIVDFLVILDYFCMFSL